MKIIITISMICFCVALFLYTIFDEEYQLDSQNTQKLYPKAQSLNLNIPQDNSFKATKNNSFQVKPALISKKKLNLNSKKLSENNIKVNNNNIDNMIDLVSNPNIELEKKLSILSKLHSMNLLGQEDKLFQLINNTSEPKLLNEYIQLFFSILQDKGNGIPIPTEEQYSKIVDMVFDMVENSTTRDYAVNKVGSILDDKDMKKLYDRTSAFLNDSQKSALLNNYVNFQILNGKDPFSDQTIKEDYQKYVGDQSNIKRRSQGLYGMIKDSSDTQDEISKDIQDNDFLKSQLETPPENATPFEYITWMKTKLDSFETSEERKNFFNDQFNNMEPEYKHELFIRLPQYLSNINNITSYMKQRGDELLNSLNESYKIDDPSVFEVLTEFRAAFLDGDDTIKNNVDKIIKKLIPELPVDTPTSADVVKFIKNEDIYFPADNFNIDSELNRLAQNNYEQEQPITEEYDKLKMGSF